MSENDWNQGVIEEFRANGGKVAQFAGRNMLLLHHTGAKTGTERVNPLVYQPVGESFAVFASKAGAPTNPDWYHNLRANPDTTVELGDETVAVKGARGRGRRARPDLGAAEARQPDLRRVRAQDDAADSGRDPRARPVLSRPRKSDAARRA